MPSLNRAILHIAATRPGVVADARGLAAEFDGARWLDLGAHFAADPAAIARDADAALAAAVAQVEAEAAEVIVTSAMLPAALAPIALTLQARLATELGAGLVLVVPDEAAAEVARAEAARCHATVAGIRLEGGTWVGETEPAPRTLRVVSGSLQAGEAVPLAVSDDDSIGDVLDRLSPEACVVVPDTRVDVIIGLLIALASGRFPAPAAVAVAGHVGEPVRRAWREFAPGVPLAETGEGGVLARARGVERAMTPLRFQAQLLRDAQAANQHIVLPEGTEPRIVRAAAEVLSLGGARITLLGDPAAVADVARREGVDISAAAVIDPATDPLRERFAAEYAELRAKKGVTVEQAHERMADVSYFGTMLVRAGLADGMVSGAVNTTAHTIRPAFEVIKTKPGVDVVSSVFFMCLPSHVLVFGDCAVNPNPTAAQLADIAAAAAVTAEQFGFDPKVALLSYSTGTSGTGPDVDLVAEATTLVRQKAPRLCVDGPLQFDAAVVETVGRSKAPGSPVAGRANVLIFPDLSAGNAAYKAVQRTAGALAIGPVLQGLNKPINDLSRGALVDDIVNTVLITAIQAGR